MVIQVCSDSWGSEQEPQLKTEEQVIPSRNGHVLSASISVSSEATAPGRAAEILGCVLAMIWWSTLILQLLLNWEILLAANNMSDDSDKEKAFLTAHLNIQHF